MATATQAPSNIQAASTGQPSVGSASLYVGDLHPDVTEPQLFDMFNRVGPVTSIRVCRDNVTRRSLGYGYVNFNNPQDADRAIELLNYTEVRGRACRLMWKQRDPSVRRSGSGNIFIKNLDKSIDSRQLDDTFSQFGNILSCKVASDDNGESRGFGFVQFESKEIADKAIEMVNGKEIEGKKVLVTHFMPRTQRDTTEASRKFNNVYIKCLGPDVTSASLEKVLATFGEVTSCVVSTNEDGTSKGFGFCNFKNVDDAVACAEALHQKEHAELGKAGVPLFACKAERASKRREVLKRLFEAKKQERQAKSQGMNLYVKNLDDDITDEKLRELFAEFGTITSCRVRKEQENTDGKSRGFGFVCFSNTDEAMRALQEMNGKTVGSRPLYVALFQPRELRRQQLQAQFTQRAQMLASMQRFPGPQMNPNMPLLFAPGPGVPQGPRGQQMFMYPQQVQRGFGGPRGGAGGMRQPMRGGRSGPRGPASGAPVAGVRNVTRTGSAPAPAAGAAAAPAQAAPQVSSVQMSKEQLVSVLSQAAPEQQKNILGERLYAMIQPVNAALAGKITGMLLEGLETSELLNLIDSPDALKAKIDEALQALHG